MAHEYGANPATDSEDSGFGQRSEVRETGHLHSNEGEEERLGDRTSPEQTTLTPCHSHRQQINTQDLQIGLESPLFTSQLPRVAPTASSGWSQVREES